MGCKNEGEWHFLTGLCNLNLYCTFSVTEFKLFSHFHLIWRFQESSGSGRICLLSLLPY